MLDMYRSMHWDSEIRMGCVAGVKSSDRKNKHGPKLSK